MKTIYIAHPLAGDGSPEWGDMEKNVERYLRFAAWASNNGHTVVSWVHHYLMHSRGLTKGDAEFYLSRDRELLRNSDILWQAGPAHTSEGLRFELGCCDEFGTPVVHFPEWDDPEFSPDPWSPLPEGAIL